MVELTNNLQRLKEEYVGRLPEKMAHLDGLVRQLAHPDSSGEVLTAMALAVHRMHGSAGTYGFVHAGRVAGEWERALDRILKSGLSPAGGDLDLMAAYLRDLQAALSSREASPERDRATLSIAPEAASEPPAALRARRPRILLVEDDRDLSVWIEEILRGKGMDCSRAGEVGEGLIHLLGREADLIISDYRLPDGRGRDLIHQVRQRDTIVPILLMSGAINKRELGEMFREAVDEFIEKPLAREPFLAAVERLLLRGLERKESRERAGALLEISSRISVGMAGGELIRMMVKTLTEITPFQAAAYFHIGPDRRSMERVAAAGPAGDAIPCPRLMADIGLMRARGFALDVAVFVPEKPPEPEGAQEGRREYRQMLARRRPWAPGDRIWVEVSTPQQIWGYLCVTQPADGMRPTEEIMRLLSLLAHNIGNVKANQALYTMETRMNAHLQVVGEIVKTALSTPDLDLIRRMVLDAAVHRLQASFAAFIEHAGGDGGYAVGLSAGRPSPSIAAGKTPPGEGIMDFLKQVEASKGPLHLEPLDRGAGPDGKRRRCAILAIPIFTRETLRHILWIEEDNQESFDVTQILIYKTLADQIGLIWSRLLYQQYLEHTGRELKESYGRLQTAHETNEKLQAIIKRYIPASTWESVSCALGQDEVEPIEAVIDLPVMFVDLAGFTRLSQTAGPRQVVDLLNTYFTTVSSIIAQWEGEIIKYIGDGLMAYFHSREKAIRAADDILKSRTKINRDLAHAVREEINLRVGIAYGPVIVCHIGPFYHRDRTLLGDTVNTASRLEKRALPGTALLDGRMLAEHTRAAEFGLVSLPPLALKGRDEPLNVLTFIRDRDAYASRQ